MTTFADTVTVLMSTNIANGTITSCGGGFYDSGGGTAGYAANENFTQTFCSGNSDKFRFSFSSFNFGTGDTLFVYDGNSVNDYLIAYYIQGSGADVLWSSGSCITFKFTSNATSQGNGWVATYQCMSSPALVNEVTTMTAGMHQVCGITLYDPSGTSNYGQGFWSHTFRAAPGQRLQFQYTSFAINGNNGGHWLRIYDGPNTSYPMIGQYNNFNFIPAIIQSSGEYLTFVFDATNTSAGFGGNSGFVGNLTCFGNALPVFNMDNITTVACEGVFYDNGGPNVNYSDNQDLTHTFCSDNGQLLRINFNNVTTAFAAGDTLWAYDGNSVNATLLGIYISGSNIEPVKSSGTCLTFRFKSNNTANARGWQGYISCVSAQSPQDTIRISSGQRTTCNAFIADNSGPFAYGHGYNQQTYRSYNGERLKFEYTLFSINGNNGGHWLRIYDGPNTSYPMIGQYNNFNFIPASIESTGEYLTFVFDRNNTSAGVGSAQGYEGILSCTTPALPIYTMGNGTLNVCEGVFYDDAGPAVNYSNGQDYTQTFCSANNQLLRIVFNALETAFASGDTLWAYDGPNTSAPPLGVYVSGSRIEPLTSTGTCLTFRYKSDATTNTRGWQGVISCITTPPATNTYIMSSGTRYVCNGIFLDHGGTGNYPVGAGNIREQTFTSYSGERLRAVVNFININGNNGGHWLRVYDGTSTAAPLIGSYNNFNGWPPAFESTGSSLTFRFESTNTNAGSGPGFQLTFNCFTGSPIDVSWVNSPICPGTSFDISYSVNATVNAGNTYTVQLSDASGSFANPTTIGTLASTALTGTINVTIPIATPAGTAYRIRVNSSQPVQLGSSNPNPITITTTPTQPGAISVTGSTTFCSGTGSATLSIPNQPGMNYRWIKDNSITVGTNSNSYIATTPGQYSVSIFNNCDSLTSTSTVTITSTDAPSPPSIIATGPTNFCSGDSVMLSVVAQMGVNYQWQLNGTNIGTNSNTIQAKQDGVYSLVLSNSCGTENSVNTIAVTVNSIPAAPTATTSYAYCVNDIATPLSATGNNLQWYSLPIGGTANSTAPTPSTVSAGVFNYYVSQSNNGCESPRTHITVTVNPAPANAGIITGTATVCQGQNAVTYTVPTIANATSYVWTLPSGATGTSSSNSITVNFGAAAVSGNITVKGVNACGDGAVATFSVTVSSIPANAGIITGTATVCQGQNAVTYTVPTIANATSYVWTLPSGATGTSSSNSITVNFGAAAVSGNITVKGVNACGDGAVATLSVTVATPPAGAGIITGNTTVCQGPFPVIYTYTVPIIPNATSYVWTLPSGATGTSSSNSITVNFGAAVSGDITVKGVNACGDGAVSNLSISVNSIPPTPIITQNGLVLESNAPMGNQWYDQNGPIPGATDSIYIATNNGNYYVVLTLSGCSSYPSNTISIIASDIELIDTDVNVKVYPNPVSSELTIEIEGDTERFNVELLNVLGQVLWRGNFIEQTRIQTNHLIPGVYLIKLESKNTFEIIKIIKE